MGAGLNRFWWPPRRNSSAITEKLQSKEVTLRERRKESREGYCDSTGDTTKVCFMGREPKVVDLSVPRGPAGQHLGRNIAHQEWRRMIHRDWGFSQAPHGATEDGGEP